LKKFDIWKDIKTVTDKFPLLKVDFDTGRTRFVGEIELLDPHEGTYIDIFKVEIILPELFPYCFPSVIELDGDIPKTIERHVIPVSGRLCLAIVFEEFMLCRNGISTLWFIERILIPRLADDSGNSL